MFFDGRCKGECFMKITGEMGSEGRRSGEMFYEYRWGNVLWK